MTLFLLKAIRFYFCKFLIETKEIYSHWSFGGVYKVLHLHRTVTRDLTNKQVASIVPVRRVGGSLIFAENSFPEKRIFPTNTITVRNYFSQTGYGKFRCCKNNYFVVHSTSANCLASLSWNSCIYIYTPKFCFSLSSSSSHVQTQKNRHTHTQKTLKLEERQLLE